MTDATRKTDVSGEDNDRVSYQYVCVLTRQEVGAGKT